MRIAANRISKVWILTALLGLVHSGYAGKKQCKKEVTAAVVANGKLCADVGRSMFTQGGSHVDAIIATALCEGVTLPHSSGIGGGFFATIITNGVVETLVAREMAPAKALDENYSSENIDEGILSVAVPGEIAGFWTLHQNYGVLQWKQLFDPVIELCSNGFTASKELADAISSSEEDIRADLTLASLFVIDGELAKEGDTIICPTLANTFRKIADNGALEMYNGGVIGQMLIEDIKAMDGIITQEDLSKYKPRLVTSESSGTIDGKYSIHTTPLPSSGPVLAFMLNVIDGASKRNQPLLWREVVEAYKFGYGHRTNLGDMEMETDADIEKDIKETLSKMTSNDYVSSVRSSIHNLQETSQDPKFYGANFEFVEDHGSVNIAVIDKDGNAVVLSSTINSNFGSKKASAQTGIILNNEMDDFGVSGVINSYELQPSKANFIKPNKMPVSSMCPTIILDNCNNVRMLVGGAGGSKITTSVLQTIVRYLRLGESLTNSVNKGRIHHQLDPMEVEAEFSVPSSLVADLHRFGHEIQWLTKGASFASVTAVGVRDGRIEPVFDNRRGGSVSTINECKNNRH